MAEYVANIDASTLATVKEEITKREQTQKLHYVYLNELQKMARELPGKYQQRLSYDLLLAVAQSLLNGTVFEIVRKLAEVQQIEERNLFDHRVRLVNRHKAQRQVMQKKQNHALLENQARAHNLPLLRSQHQREVEVMEKRFEEEIKKMDKKIILDLDQKVMEQQSFLEKAGVPAFFVTNKPHEIRLQMYLLEFIAKLQDTHKHGS